MADNSVNHERSHYLNIELDNRPPDWERARKRIQLLTDEQIAEAGNLVEEHGGSDVGPDIDIKTIRSQILKSLESFKDNLFERSPGPTDSPTSRRNALDPNNFKATWISTSGHWEGPDHKILFSLSVLGILQAAGYQVEGYNIPVYPPDMPLDYWPADGLKIFWRP